MFCFTTYNACLTVCLNVYVTEGKVKKIQFALGKGGGTQTCAGPCLLKESISQSQTGPSKSTVFYLIRFTVLAKVSLCQ